MAQAPPPPGPGYVPPRPDLPASRGEPASRRLVVAFVAAVVLAAVLGVLAVASLQRGRSGTGDRATATAAVTDSPSPSATASPRPRIDGAFRFLERVGGEPVRWNPCDPIAYAINTDGATSSVQPDLRRALARVTEATGIVFTSLGATEETFIHAYRRMRYQGVNTKAELILIWVDHEDYRAILRRLHDRRPSVAFAKTMAGLYADRDQYFGGIVVMDADATARRGFGDNYAHGSVLLHELGHIMGLDHVKDADQLMYSGPFPNFGVHDFGPGDLEGLRRLGTDAGCLD